MEPLEVVYNFKSLEQLLKEHVLIKAQYNSFNIEYDWELIIGINNFQAIFVIK